MTYNLWIVFLSHNWGLEFKQREPDFCVLLHVHRACWYIKKTNNLYQYLFFIKQPSFFCSVVCVCTLSVHCMMIWTYLLFEKKFSHMYVLSTILWFVEILVKTKCKNVFGIHSVGKMSTAQLFSYFVNIHLLFYLSNLKIQAQDC